MDWGAGLGEREVGWEGGTLAASLTRCPVFGGTLAASLTRCPAFEGILKWGPGP